MFFFCLQLSVPEVITLSSHDHGFLKCTVKHGPYRVNITDDDVGGRQWFCLQSDLRDDWNTANDNAAFFTVKQTSTLRDRQVKMVYTEV